MQLYVLLLLMLSCTAAAAQLDTATAASIGNLRVSKPANPGCTTLSCSACRAGYGCGVRANSTQQCVRKCARCPAGFTSRSGPASSTWCTKATGKCAGKCGRANIAQPNGDSCSCDWWSQNVADSCDVGKNAACPDFAPRLTKTVIASCRSNINVLPTRISNSSKCNTYRPGQCYCDEWCTKAEDCCSDCPKECPPKLSRTNAAGLHTGRSSSTAAAAAAAAAAADGEDLPVSIAAQAAVASIAAQHRALRLATAPDAGAHDCGNNKARLEAVLTAATAAGVVAASAGPVVWTAATGETLSSISQAQDWLLKCQAADKGPPVDPYRIPVNWVQAIHCTDAGRTQCTGNEYGKRNVWDQIEMLNDKFARIGIQFDWDGKISRLYVDNPVMDSTNCYASPECIECRAIRAGDTAFNVMTTPTYLDGVAVGQAMYPWYRKFEAPFMPACADWVQIFWRSLPGQGAVSTVDKGPMDGGGVLAHEAGHYLGLGHTWYEGNPASSAKQQCSASASLAVLNIIQGLSDGVRDTPAISLNTAAGGKIIRFVNCSTYEYTSDAPIMQQSCTSATASFPQGDRYYNPYFNLMSYGDKSCIRVITPGQAARMRCSHRCFRLGDCSL